jgi:hypothetical protein
MPITNGFADVASDITRNFDLAWRAQGRNEAVIYENAPPVRIDAKTCYARLSVVGATAVLAGIGERAADDTGLVLFEAFAPVGSGTLRVRAMIDSATIILQGQSLGGASFGSAQYQVVGVAPGDDHWKENVSFPYTFGPVPS